MQRKPAEIRKTREPALLAIRPQSVGTLLILLMTAVPAPAEVIESVDLSGSGDDDHRYYVVLCARRSEPWGAGHAFVVWAKHTGDGEVLDASGLGFYPNTKPRVVRFFGSRGEVVDESTNDASVKPTLLTHRLVCQVDRQTFIRSRSAVTEWNDASPDYHLFACNCKHFAYEIARSIGLEAPKPRIAERPPVYINRLIDAASTTTEQ